MPFCPGCGTEVSGDTRFCPECGQPLMPVGEASNGKNKNKIIGIIAACIVAIIVIVVIATHPPAFTEPEPAIPDHYTTYTDEQGLFSISYPPQWELELSSIEEIQGFVEDIVSSITSDIPIEEANIVFMAGVPIGNGYLPNVNITVEPLNTAISTHDDMAAAGIQGLRLAGLDYHEYSRVKTTVDGRTATIIECQINLAGFGTLRYLLMCCIVNKTVWGVTCTALPDGYSEWEDDFDAIVRSLRILK